MYLFDIQEKIISSIKTFYLGFNSVKFYHTLCYLNCLGQLEMKPDINRSNIFEVFNIFIAASDFYFLSQKIQQDIL